MAGFVGPSAPADRCVVLDSARSHARWGRFSYLAADPIRLLRQDRSGRVEWLDLAGSGLAPSGDGLNGLDALRAASREVELDEEDRPGDARFVGGWVGFLSYEFGSALEGVAPPATDDIPLPRMQWAFYDAVACYEHATGHWRLSALVLDSSASAMSRLDELQHRLSGRRSQSGRSGGGRRRAKVAMATARGPAGRGESVLAPLAGGDDWTASVECNFSSRPNYEQAVRRGKDYIAAGDIYQVNLSQRFSWPMPTGPGTPGELFGRLRRAHPAYYSALLTWPEPSEDGAEPDCVAICSASPELLLSVRPGPGVPNRPGLRLGAPAGVISRPIKGTRRRAADARADRAAIAELLASEKDAAELAMIVDLERNDLGRVCRFGSIQVAEPRGLETHAHVHHTVATIQGELAAGRDLADVLAATFPGGSITGAPKVRAMQIIAELEPTARSVYTGAIGYIGVDGSAMLNIAIRTVLLAGGKAHLQVGGAIVADSDPAAEYEETLAKAQGLAQAIASVRDQVPVRT